MIELEHVGTAADPLRLLLILRADRRDDDLVALGEFKRLPDESVNALKARIERQHPAGLLMLHATYVEPGLIAD